MRLNVLTLNKELEAALADKDSLLKKLAEIETERDSARKEADSAKESALELTKQIDALKAENEFAKNSANEKAASTLATLGVAPDAIKDAITSEPDLVSQFNSLEGSAKTAFYKKNRLAILKASGLKS